MAQSTARTNFRTPIQAHRRVIGRLMGAPARPFGGGAGPVTAAEVAANQGMGQRDLPVVPIVEFDKEVRPLRLGSFLTDGNGASVGLMSCVIVATA